MMMQAKGELSAAPPHRFHGKFECGARPHRLYVQQSTANPVISTDSMQSEAWNLEGPQHKKLNCLHDFAMSTVSVEEKQRLKFERRLRYSSQPQILWSAFDTVAVRDSEKDELRSRFSKILSIHSLQ